uniref:lens fiber membrane intrinsic protein-like n=1 Tax=Podarcis muralis TaxID=64176 RepID=UPI00109FD046|nr:lens fiber membrane intrinsic protein-like [Podarcis muralis]
MCSLEVITEIFAALCFVLHIAALSTEHWLSNVNEHMGLWKGCHGTQCVLFGVQVPPYMQATRTLMLLALLAGSFSLLSITSIFFQCPFGCISKPRISTIFSTIAGLFVLVSVCVFTSHMRPTDNSGWSLYLAWASIPLCLVTGEYVWHGTD